MNKPISRKKIREILFNKYGGKCAYCGCGLETGWHVDEVEPIRRNHIWDRDKRRFMINKNDPMMFPERLVIENQNPSCPSCNINKHSMTLEEFRNSIKNYMKHLNEKSTQFKMSKKYGLVIETDEPVVFYFETYSGSNSSTDK